MPSAVLLSAFYIQYVAAQSVTSLFLPGIVSQALVGSVIDSAGSDECGIDGVMTAIEGPRTAIINIIDTDDDISAYIKCNLANSAAATCTSTIDGSGAGQYTGISTVTITDVSTMYFPVTMTDTAATSTPTTIHATSSGLLASQTSTASSDGVKCSKVDNRLIASCALTLLVLATL